MIFGTAGGSLSTSTSWAKAGARGVRRGRDGEIMTAAILDPLAYSDRGPTVLHDVSVPGYNAQVDHIVVSGNKVLLIDTKVWDTGTYLGWGSKTWRNVGKGWSSFPHANVKALDMGLNHLGPKLPGHARFLTPLVIVHPSNNERRTLLFVHNPGTRFVTAAQAETLVKARMSRPADRGIVDALRKWVR